jgi:hypothetical protein
MLWTALNTIYDNPLCKCIMTWVILYNLRLSILQIALHLPKSLIFLTASNIISCNPLCKCKKVLHSFRYNLKEMNPLCKAICTIIYLYSGCLAVMCMIRCLYTVLEASCTIIYLYSGF